MTSVTGIEWVKPPLAPVIVSVNVPLLALQAGLMIRVELPGLTTDEDGLKLAVVLLGSPLTLRFTVLETPFTVPTVTV